MEAERQGLAHPEVFADTTGAAAAAANGSSVKLLTATPAVAAAAGSGSNAADGGGSSKEESSKEDAEPEGQEVDLAFPVGGWLKEGTYNLQLVVMSDCWVGVDESMPVSQWGGVRFSTGVSQQGGRGEVDPAAYAALLWLPQDGCFHWMLSPLSGNLQSGPPDCRIPLSGESIRLLQRVHIGVVMINHPNPSTEPRQGFSLGVFAGGGSGACGCAGWRGGDASMVAAASSSTRHTRQSC